MSDTFSQTIGADAGKKQEQTIELRPTLFIGVGGTGMEVLMRVRRRILNTLWGSATRRTRVESLVEFPVAQFIQFDLDNGAIVEANRAQADDLQFPLVRFTDDERVVETFDMDKYSRDDDALEKYPHVKNWLSLTPKKIRELGIDPGKGAGQIRAVSRLYLFDKYTKLRDKIRIKLRSLKAGLSHERQLAELLVERHQIGQIEAAVDRGEMRRRHAPGQRKVQRGHVKVEDVEVVGALHDLFDHQHVSGKWIHAPGQPLRPLAYRHEGAGGARIATCE